MEKPVSVRGDSGSGSGTRSVGSTTTWKCSKCSTTAWTQDANTQPPLPNCPGSKGDDYKDAGNHDWGVTGSSNDGGNGGS